jgi:hypothetical protein
LGALAPALRCASRTRVFLCPPLIPRIAHAASPLPLPLPLLSLLSPPCLSSIRLVLLS